VLRLLGTYLARVLSVLLNTMRPHTSNAYAKLGRTGVGRRPPGARPQPAAKSAPRLTIPPIGVCAFHHPAHQVW